MYAKVYRITCNPGQSDAMMAYYDDYLEPTIKESEYHAGHHMINSGENEWLLVSNYVSEEAATAAVPMVQEIIKPMVEQFGMKLVPVT